MEKVYLRIGHSSPIFSPLALDHWNQHRLCSKLKKMYDCSSRQSNPKPAGVEFPTDFNSFVTPSVDFYVFLNEEDQTAFFSRSGLVLREPKVNSILQSIASATPKKADRKEGHYLCFPSCGLSPRAGSISSPRYGYGTVGYSIICW